MKTTTNGRRHTVTELPADDQPREQVFTSVVPLLLDQRQAWQFVGMSRPGWYRARALALLPAPVRIAGTGLRWRKADLEEYVNKLKPSTRRRAKAKAQ